MTGPTIRTAIMPGAYNDRTCEGNGAAHHTGKECIERGCHNPAGTAWSPYWCVECNIARIDGINAGWDEVLRQAQKLVDDYLTHVRTSSKGER